MKTKLRKVTKLWKGMYISLRDYEIQKAIDDNYSIQAVHKGEVMMLTPSRLKEIDLTVGTPQKSIYDGNYAQQFGPNKFSAYQAITHWSTHYPSDSVNTRYDRERKVSNMSWFSQAA